MFGYLFTWTRSAGMLTSTQLKETRALDQNIFFCFLELHVYGGIRGKQLSANKWKQHLQISPLQSRVLQFPAAERMTTDCFCLFLCPALLKVLMLHWCFVTISSFICRERTSHFLIRPLVFQSEDPTVLGSLSIFLGCEYQDSRTQKCCRLEL